MRIVLAHIVTFLILLGTAWGQNTIQPTQPTYNQTLLNPTLDQSLTLPFLSEPQLETFSSQATQKVEDFYAYLVYAQDPTVQATLRKHALGLMMQDLDEMFVLATTRQTYRTDLLFPPDSPAILAPTSTPPIIQEWEAPWEAKEDGTFERILRLELPLILKDKPVKAIAFTLKLERIEKQFGEEKLGVWEIQIKKILVRKG